MKFKEFGNNKLPKIVILHGGGLSWWSLEPVINILSQKYCVITPIIDGHGEDGDTTFISISNSSKKLITYIDEMYNGQIHALCGLSIGAQIVVEILSKRSDICKYALIESALIKPLKFIKSLIVPMIYMSYPLIKRKWYSRLQAKTLLVPVEKLDQYYKDSCSISRTSLINITISNASFKLNPNIKNTKVKVLIFVGEKEIKIMKKSAIELNAALKNSELKIIPKCGHGELSLRKPEEYCNYIYELLSK